MNIETKYNAEDQVFYMLNDKICKGTVVGVRVDTSSRNPEETYYIENSDGAVWSRTNNVNNLFESQEDLIESLKI